MPSSGEHEGYEKGLTLRVLVIVIIMTPLCFIFNMLLSGLTAWWVHAGMLPPSIMYIILINELLGRISPRLKLSRAELAVLLTAFFALGGFAYTMYGELKFGINIVSTYNNIMSAVFALATDPAKTYWMDKYSPLWAPPIKYVELAWSGLKAGQTIDWSQWMAPMAFWILYFITWTTWSYMIAFMLRKQMVEVEKLPFIMVLPTAYPIVWSTEPKDSPESLFNFKTNLAKIFWAMFILGFIGTIPDLLRYFLPFIPPSSEWSTHPINLNAFTQSILPGASLVGNFIIPRAAIFTLLPLDFLVSAVVGWFVVFVVYPSIGVATGLLPYTPGAENNPWYYGQTVGPMRAIYATNTGIILGIGLYALYMAWPNIKRIFTSLYGEDVEEQGVSYRFVSISFIVLSIIFIALFCIVGAPIAIVIPLLIFYFINEVGNIYTMGYYPYLTDFAWFTVPFSYYTGLSLGFWGSEIPNPSVVAARTIGMSACLNIRYISYNGRLLCGAFKIGDMARARAKDILYMMIIVAVLSAIVAIPGTVWLVHNYGAKNLSLPVTSGIHAQGLWYVAQPPIITPDIFLSHSIGGALITLLLYALRLRFPEFMINPVGMAVAIFSPTWYGFPNMLVALIIKWLILKAGGVRLWEERAIPAIIGFTCGYGFTYVLIQWLAFFTKVMPKL